MLFVDCLIHKNYTIEHVTPVVGEIKIVSTGYIEDNDPIVRIDVAFGISPTAGGTAECSVDGCQNDRSRTVLL